MIPLHADETVSDLARGGLRLIQSRRGFRFGEDTVLLADYAARQLTGPDNRSRRAADLGAGNGASSLLLAARCPGVTVLAVEIDAHSLSMLDRNRQLNSLQDRLTILASDYSRWPDERPALSGSDSLDGAFDLVMANPPYGVANGGPVGEGKRRNARQEHTMTLDSLIRASAYLLRPHGRLVLIHRSSRLTDVLTAMRLNHIEPKSLRMVASVEGRSARRFLVSGVRLSRPGSLDVEPVLAIRDPQHQLTDEIRRIYQNDPLLTESELFSGLTPVESDWQPDVTSER